MGGNSYVVHSVKTVRASSTSKTDSPNIYKSHAPFAVVKTDSLNFYKLLCAIQNGRVFSPNPMRIFFFASSYGRVASRPAVNLEILYDLKLVRKSIQNSWVSQSDNQLIPRMTSENAFPLITWFGSNTWTEGGVELMRRTRSLSRAGQQETKWKASSMGSPQSLHDGSAGVTPLILLWNLTASFSRPSHPANKRILKLVAQVRWTFKVTLDV